ncbi:MAG: ComF family protein [Pelolinea sp.]|nr:ComF family protein [Pelolinea sp.]
MQNNGTVGKLILSRPNSFWRFIDLLYPPFCCNCGKIGYEICPECFSEIETISTQQICKICGRIISADKTCPICEKSHPVFDQARSWGIYTGALKQIIQKIKYERGFGVIEYISKPLIECIINWGISADLIVPIPLGKQREKERGYNQSALIASPISNYFDIPINDHALTRIRETRSQVGLNYEERNNNIKDAFQADRSAVFRKSVLLIDDIATTCATLNESAKALRYSGASKIFCFTVAQTKKPIDY